MRLVKAVSRKLFHQVKDFRGSFSCHTALSRALNEDCTLALHFFDVFLTHGTTQQVCAAQRVAADCSSNQHHLFLIDHDAVCFAQNRLHTGIKVLHFLSPELSIDEVRNLIHRTRTIQSV